MHTIRPELMRAKFGCESLCHLRSQVIVSRYATRTSQAMDEIDDMTEAD